MFLKLLKMIFYIYVNFFLISAMGIFFLCFDLPFSLNYLGSFSK